MISETCFFFFPCFDDLASIYSRSIILYPGDETITCLSTTYILNVAKRFALDDSCPPCMLW